jgi:hypothetical protein
MRANTHKTRARGPSLDAQISDRSAGNKRGTLCLLLTTQELREAGLTSRKTELDSESKWKGTRTARSCARSTPLRGKRRSDAVGEATANLTKYRARYCAHSR